MALCLFVTTYTLPPDKLAKAIEYARERHRLYFIAAAWGFAVLAAILYARVGPRLRDWCARVTAVRFLQTWLYAVVLLGAIDLLTLPIGMRYHWLAVKYEQSIQPWASWLSDWALGESISLAVGGLLVCLFYIVVRRSPRRWWLYGWLASIPLTVFAMFVYPLVVSPLFYRFTPLTQTHPQVAAEIQKVTARGGLDLPRDRIFEMDASTKLKSINAYVTGVGSSKRVVVWDTTLKTLNLGQTLFVFGHEMGHYVLHHVWWGMALSCAGTLVLLLGTWYLLRWRGIAASDLASFPVLLLLLAASEFAATPIVNSITRYQEHQADIYGLEAIHGIVPDSRQAAAEAFQIMGEIGLADPSPSRFVEFWLYSHPSVSSRVRFASEYDPWSNGEAPRYVR